MQITTLSASWRRLANFAVVLTTWFCLFGCTGCPQSGGDFIGRYEMVRPEGKLYLDVLADGIFSERFEPAGGGEALFRKGTWKFHADKQKIQFVDFMSINTTLSGGSLALRMKERLDAWLSYHCKWGKIDIYVDEDRELFHKI